VLLLFFLLIFLLLVLLRGFNDFAVPSPQPLSRRERGLFSKHLMEHNR